MLPPKLSLPADQQHLLGLYRQLPQAARESLLSYAEFLLERGANEPALPQRAVPEEIPRPAKESVIAAIRRLSATYHMLDRGALLHETSELMTAHIMQGRPAVEVIDQLELVFRRHYERIESAGDR